MGRGRNDRLALIYERTNKVRLRKSRPEGPALDVLGSAICAKKVRSANVVATRAVL